MEKNDKYRGQPEIIAQVHAIERTITVHCEDSDIGTVFGEFFIERTITVHCEDSDIGTVFGEFFNDCSSTDILYYPEKRDDITCYLREQHCSVNRKMKTFLLWVTMLPLILKQMIGSCMCDK